jgi:adenylate kinase
MDSRLQKVKNWLGNGSINIFGWPFSGKDTQGQRLAKLFNASLIGGGEILRNAQNVPRHVHEIIDKGGLAPIDDYLNIIIPYLSKPEYSGKPIIMSSVGRWHGEEGAIVKGASDSGHPLKAVINLKLTEAIAKKRAAKSKLLHDRGERADDTDKRLETRFDEFRNKTLPVIEFYRQKGLLVEIDGSLPPEEVTNQIINRLSIAAKIAESHK